MWWSVGFYAGFLWSVCSLSASWISNLEYRYVCKKWDLSEWQYFHYKHKNAPHSTTWTALPSLLSPQTVVFAIERQQFYIYFETRQPMNIQRKNEAPSKTIVAVEKERILHICVCVRAWLLAFVCICAHACVHVCVCVWVGGCPSAWACIRVPALVALLSQHANRMRHTVLSFAATLAPPHSSTLSHKWHDFRKKFSKRKMCAFTFSITFT